MLSKPYLTGLLSAFIMHITAVTGQVVFSDNKRVSDAAYSFWESDAQSSIDRSQYLIERTEYGSYTAINDKNKLGFIIHPYGYEVKKVLTTVDAKDFFVRFNIESIQGQKLDKNSHTDLSSGNLVFSNSIASIEYMNSQDGLKQNFIIDNKVYGIKPVVTIRIKSSMNFQLNNSGELIFTDKITGKIGMMYDRLKVWDAHNKQLSATMKLDGNLITLEADDTEAVYPVTIDPLNHIPEWTTSSDGILPSLLNNLSLQIDAAYGYSATGLGDINGDGYDDVAIGAPGAINIVSSTTFLQAGAVFVYYGSPSGLPVTPSKILRSTTPVAGALFGLSIAAGDVTGSSANDIIVGAPLDSYSTQAATAIIGTSSATVTSGKVYVFRAEDMASGTPSPFLDVKLEGTNYFSKGILSVLLSNITNKNLLGFSVAVAGDMNNDSKGEIVAGAPGYLGIGLTAIRSGAAFVYYSNDLNNPVELSAPSSTLLGIPSLPLLNTEGLLFGYSVDGAGDFNGDNIPDVVIGAPAGINLNSLGGIFAGKTLSGSAYVYYGILSGGVGAGISPTTTTRLEPSATGLLGTGPNLFGYSVKGITNASGVRNGRILVGAPLGNLLSNIVGGLQLKTGSVYLYKTYSAGAILPDQTITSPRGTSLTSILTGHNLSVSAMFGASLDNVLDINCDGISDIVIGEPLSTGVGLIGVDVIGGAAVVLTGNMDGTYNTTPFSILTTTVSTDLGVNVASLLGFSVAGGGRVRGLGFPPRIIAGAPGKALDFGTGLLDLGTTFNTLFSFASGDNGLGKAYGMAMGSCSVLPATLLSFQAVKKEQKATLSWKTTNELNITSFEVLHSTDGIRFTAIGQLRPSAVRKEINEYNLDHLNPSSGINYYKLKINDNDKKASFSAVQQVNFNSIQLTNVQVIPNPVTDNGFRLEVSGMKPGPYRVDIVNAAGQLQQTVMVMLSRGEQVVQLLRTSASSGMYAVNLYDNMNRLVSAKKVIFK